MTNPSNPSMGYLGQWLVDPTTTISGSSECYDYKRWGFQTIEEIVDANAVRGTRSRAMERKRAGSVKPGGPIVFMPSTAALRLWLPRILGAAETGAGPYTYAVAETLPTFSMAQSRVAKDFQWNGCKINKATFRGAAGEAMEWELDIQGSTEIENNAGTISALNVVEPTDSFFMFQDLGVTLNGTSYEVFDCEISIDNQLELERLMNSQTRRAMPEQDRLVGVKLSLPYTADEVGIYTQGQLTDIPVVGTWTNGTHILTISMTSCQFELKTPHADAKEEIKLVLEGFAATKTVTGTTTKEIICTLTSP